MDNARPLGKIVWTGVKKLRRRFPGGEFYGGGQVVAEEFCGGEFYGGEFYGGEFYGGGQVVAWLEHRGSAPRFPAPAYFALKADIVRSMPTVAEAFSPPRPISC